MTSLGRVYGSSPRRLAASAVRLAAADAGIALADIDGLLICPGITGGLDVGLAGQLGMRDLSLLAVINSMGASAVGAVQTAALAVSSGSARTVACVFADTPLAEGARAGAAFGNLGGARGSAGPGELHGLGGLAAGYGFRSVTVYYALAARRHMERFGTTSEQLGSIAVAQRQWAAGNPLAQFRDPITIAEHQQSRWVAEPLHLLDCSLVSNGAVAVIITSAQAAAAGPRPAVHIWGWGQGHPGHPMAAGSDFGLVTGAVQAGRAAMGMARVSPAEVTMCQLYDCYTHTVLVTLEDYGFCAKGEGGSFAASGALGPGGSLPVNTGGGQLSAYYMWGFTPLSEAVIQARGDGGDRQCDATDVILVSGNGGLLAHHGTLILSPHQAPAAAARPGQERSDDTPAPSASPGPPGPQHGGDPLLSLERQLRATAFGAAGGQETAGGQQTAGGQEGGQADAGPAPAPAPGPVPGPGSMSVIRADPRSEPFFAAAGRGELVTMRCDNCAQWLSPSATQCPRCGEDEAMSWTRVSGAGVLVSWSVVPSRHDGGPIAVPALVELAEGPWLSAGLRLTGQSELASLRAGLPVAVEFDSPAEGASYPVFRPLGIPG